MTIIPATTEIATGSTTHINTEIMMMTNTETNETPMTRTEKLIPMKMETKTRMRRKEAMTAAVTTATMKRRISRKIMKWRLKTTKVESASFRPS